MPVDYHVWKGLPQRDTSERIARYGQGFSKILANLRGDNESQGNIAAYHVHDKMSLHQAKKNVHAARSSIDVSTHINYVGGPQGSGEFGETTRETQASNFNVQDGLNTISHNNTTIGFFKGGSNISTNPKHSPHFSSKTGFEH